MSLYENRNVINAWALFSKYHDLQGVNKIQFIVKEKNDASVCDTVQAEYKMQRKRWTENGKKLEKICFVYNIYIYKQHFHIFFLI